jgi:putative GTP pyrophosphokinase
MLRSLTDKSFLERNQISSDAWKKANISWATLLEIGEDHEANSDRLRESAELFARLVQKFKGVHSVRWRVKDPEHLLAKIVRKRQEAVEKYMEITRENYFETVTDLVGIRALHLFKEDCFDIDAALRATWTPSEQPIAYIRQGDQDGLTRRFQEQGFAIKSHPAGYRSVHYVIASQPVQRKVMTEVQVRTIFEEGWSEIDHSVRYPNFSDNELVAYFLAIFNRMAGSADEMGGFVRGLAAKLHESQAQRIEADRQNAKTLAAMQKMVTELAELKQQDAQSKKTLSQLQSELEKFKSQSAVSQLFVSNSSELNALLTSANKLSSFGIAGGEPRGPLSDALFRSSAEPKEPSLVFSNKPPERK